MPISLIDIIKPKNGGQFPMVEDVDFKGGFRCVQDVAARDGIFALNRKPNMFVYAKDEDKLFKWGSPWIDNTSWIEISVGGSGGGADQGLTARRMQLELLSASPSVTDFQVDQAGSEFKTVARFRTWVPEAQTTTAANFTMPAINSNVTISLTNGKAYSVLTLPAQILYVVGAGYFRVDGVSGNDIDAHNLGTYLSFPSNASPTTVITTGAAASLPFGDFGDSVVYGRADGTGIGYDEFTQAESFTCSSGGSSGCTVLAARDLILSGGTQSGNTHLSVRYANSGTITAISGDPGTLAGGAACLAAPFVGTPPVMDNTAGLFAYFSSPSDGHIWSYGLDLSPGIIQADLGGMTKPHGMVVTDDGYFWVCDRVDDTTANGELRQYVPLSTGNLNGTPLPAFTGFLSQCQIVYTGRYIFGLDSTGSNAVLHRFDTTTHNLDSYELPTPSEADRSALYFDGVMLWVSARNHIYRVDPQNYGVQFHYADPNSAVRFGAISESPSGDSLLIAYRNSSTTHVGIKKFAARRTVEVDRLRVKSIAANSAVVTNANGELVGGVPSFPLSGDVTGTPGATVVAAIHGKSTPTPGGGDDGKALVYDAANNRYILNTIGAPSWKWSTVSAGVLTTIDIEGQNAPRVPTDSGSGSILALHKPPYGRDTFSMQPALRWPSRSRGMELYLASSTATDLVFTDKHLAVLHSSITDYPVTLHDPASGQQVTKFPSTPIGSSGWDSIYFVSEEAIADGTAPKPHFLYLQKSGTNEMARINVETGVVDLFTSPSTTNGPIYVHESGTIAWMAGGTLVFTGVPCDPSVPTIQTSSLTGKDSDAASSLVVVPSVYNVGPSQSGFMAKAWITQPLSEELVVCDFPGGTNSATLAFTDGAGHTRPRQIAFDGTFLIVNAMTTGYPGDASTLGVLCRFDPVNQLLADTDDNAHGCSHNGSLICDGKFIIASDATKTNTNVTTDNDDSIHIRSSDFPVVSAANGKARMGGLRIAAPSRIATPRNGSSFFGLYAVCAAPTPGIYRYIDRPALFAQSINLAGGFIDHVVRADANYTVTSFDSTVALHDLVANINLVLPVNPVLGQTFCFVDEDGSFTTWTATIDGNGNDVNGSPTYTMGGSMALARQAVTVKWTGGQWSIV